jgi:hypothetical protein
MESAYCASLDAKIYAEFWPKIMFYAVLNWEMIQFLESARFAWIWEKKGFCPISSIMKIIIGIYTDLVWGGKESLNYGHPL